jgi:Rer1 family
LVAVAYSLGIYLLNLFLAFLQPKFDPSNEAIDNEMEDGSAGGLPTKQDEEFRPFIRRLPEFKFWYSATRAITIGFVCTWFSIFDVPVFWPVLVVYWLILFALTSRFPWQEWEVKRSVLMRSSAETDPTYDQVPICAILNREDEVQQEQQLVG